jgi:hypothetical protein
MHEREGEEQNPGWPDRIGAHGYAAYLLSLSNPAEKGKGVDWDRDAESERTVCVEDEDEEVRRRGSVKLPIAEQEREYTPFSSSRLSEDSSEGGETGVVARRKCWRGRGTTTQDDAVRHFAAPLRAVEGEGEVEPKSPRLEVFPCQGSDFACFAAEQEREGGGLTAKDRARRVREWKREVRKYSKEKERERVKREGRGWKWVGRILGCGV